MVTLIMFCLRAVLMFFFTLFWNEGICRINPNIDTINSWISLTVLFFITFVEFEVIRPWLMKSGKKNQDNDNEDDKK